MNAFASEYRAMLRRVFTDSGAALLMLGAIAIYSMFYPLPYLRQVVKDVPIAVVDLDGTSLSRQLARWTDAHENVHVVLRTTQPREAEASIMTGAIDGYLIIPAGFRADVLRGRSAVLLYGGDAGRFLVLKQVLTGFTETAGTLSASVEVKRLLGAGQGRDQALVNQGPVQILAHPLFNTREGYGSYLIPAVFVMILQQTLVLGVGLLLGTDRERTVRESRRDRTALRFAGSCAALITIYIAHAAFYFGFSFWLFDIPRHGHPLALGVFLIPFLIAAVLFAHVLAVPCRERESSLQVLLFTSIPFLFLAGFAWPLGLMSPPLRWLAHLIPSTAGIQGFLRLNQMGAGLDDVRYWWWNLWALCALYAWPAWWSWRRSGS